MSFDGTTFDEERDGKRLRKQLRAVWAVMIDKNWHTLHEISSKARAPQASVSARLRDFRKSKFGGHTVLRQYIRRGLFIYKLIPHIKDK